MTAASFPVVPMHMQMYEVAPPVYVEAPTAYTVEAPPVYAETPMAYTLEAPPVYVEAPVAYTIEAAPRTYASLAPVTNYVAPGTAMGVFGTCVCGNVFMEDSVFCRKCGRKRPVN